MALPSPVPPPVMRMRLSRRRSLRNMGACLDSAIRKQQVPHRGCARFGMTKLRWVARDAEAVIGILKFGRDAGAGGAAGGLHVMAPRSAAGGFALADS